MESLWSDCYLSTDPQPPTTASHWNRDISNEGQLGLGEPCGIIHY